MLSVAKPVEEQSSNIPKLPTFPHSTNSIFIRMG